MFAKFGMAQNAYHNPKTSPPHMRAGQGSTHRCAADRTLLAAELDAISIQRAVDKESSAKNGRRQVAVVAIGP